MAAPVGPVLANREELLQCALPVWYESFKYLTIKSVFIPLSQAFVDYLGSDGLVLPEGCELPGHVISNDESNDEEENEQSWVDQEDDESLMGPVFPELIQEISDSIQTLNGNVFPKLNWSAPRDAIWISPGNTLRCTTPAEIILLLKSSDFISHDLSLLEDTNTETGSHDGETGSQDDSITNNDTGSQDASNTDNKTGSQDGSITDIKTGADDDSITNNKTDSQDSSINDLKTGSQDVCSVTLYTNNTDKGHDRPAHMLCLRKWTSIQSSSEFRCFVKDNDIIAISQRDCTSFYEYLCEYKETILQDILKFHSSKISTKFPIKDYVMDVFRPNENEVVLIDFNPFSIMTDGLLFSWEELDSITTPVLGTPELRLITDSSGIQPSSLYTTRLPKDVLDLSTGTDIHKLLDLLKLHNLQQ